MTKRKALGRGLDTLFYPEGSESSGQQTPTVLPIDQLRAGKYQPRTRMDEGALIELAESIRAQGVMQPILVRPVAGGGYEIIAGERRKRAAAIAGLTEVPVLVRDVPDAAAAAMALIENIQREELGALEEAHAIQRLLTEFEMTHDDAAKAIGRSRSATSNILRLLNLAAPVQTMLLAGDIQMGHARALLAVDAASQIALAHKVHERKLSVRETEKLVGAIGKEFNLSQQKKPREKSRDVLGLEEELSDRLATRVTVRANPKGRGQVQIDFGSLEELDGLLARLRK